MNSTKFIDKQEANKNCEWPRDLSQFTPLFRQYLEIKYSYDLDILLMFRVGDFYETFFEDAKTLAKTLELTLTSRSEANYPGGKIPMAGIPAKSLVNYVSRLLEHGYKVAICEQMEDPTQAKGVVRREVTKLLTPGTILEPDWLPISKNNFIASVYKDKKSNTYGFAYADVSCGEFYFSDLTKGELTLELGRVNPSEVIVPYAYETSINKVTKEKVLNIDSDVSSEWFCTALEEEYFKKDFAVKRIVAELKLSSIESIGYKGQGAGLIAAASILAYIDKTQLTEKTVFEKIKPYELNSFLSIDRSTRKNLELVETVRDRTYDGSLFWAIDYTKTQMGKRRLRTWIEQPLIDPELINTRLSCVEELVKNKHLFYELSTILERIFDLERISSRLSALAVNAKELVALKSSLSEIPSLSEKLKSFRAPFFKALIDYPVEIIDVANIIEESILDNPSSILTEGRLIKPEFNLEVKELQEIIENGTLWLKSYEEMERVKTGIKNLKVGFNRTFGYFIEISKGNLPFVPQDYTCKQTMVNSSRFITQELKDFEQKALHAEQKIKNLEYELFCEIREKVKNYSSVIRKLAFDVSNLDALFSLAQTAVINNYKRPEINNSEVIELRASRHPVIEKKVGFNNFVSNDCYLTIGEDDKSENQLMILTGPNMAGKSTYMRQIALNVILAQAGSFVPCDFAKIGVVDQIFTRVGATDDIALGQSTFMVEMVETSAIINRMTERSLILLDEVGRGTSTYDGVAIAWSLAEYLVKNKGARTVFATHFHELNGLADLYNAICNYQVTVKEEDGQVIFLRKVVPGGADKSYGIEVAKMAGLPKELYSRAQTIMHTMYSKSKTPTKKETIKSHIESGQLKLFG
ncbi:MAG: DNA mismatch repair protein MutS [Candidatus Melainabacteria bacterium]|nr:DNA mismatch repair protein MutS [Candidatus Melainabacteria bacterium]